MVQFAVQKKFTRTRSTSSAPFFSLVSRLVSHVPLRFLWWFFGVFVLVYGIFLFFHYLIFSPQDRIVTVDYALSSVQLYDNPYLYKAVSTLIKGENQKIILWNKDSLLSQIQQQFPFVRDLVFVYKGNRKMFVKILFEEFPFLVRADGYRFGVYGDEIYQLYSGNLLGSGSRVLDIMMFSGSGSTGEIPHLSGLFLPFSGEYLLETMHLLDVTFSGYQQLFYVPGGKRMQMRLPNQQLLYINLAIPLDQQIVLYRLLQRYYPDVNRLKEIDLGSLEKDKVIVRR